MRLTANGDFDLETDGEVRRVDVRENVRRLGQVRYLKREVDMLSQQIAALTLEGEHPPVGPNGAKVDEARQAWVQKLDERRWRCMELLGELYAFIDDIDDSRMRQIITYRYVYGETWQRVATRIGEIDEQYPRRLHNRFLAGVEAPGGGE